ncbi:hypothetical protein [Janibacter sp. G1551]|uniref:hypothetical protein n=1 Tax=Janibacter sp. G1551 TaxID=3420440 RepID=UPI003D02A280
MSEGSRWSTAALVGLLVVDVALVAAAFAGVRFDASSRTDDSPSRFAGTTSGAPSDTVSETTPTDVEVTRRPATLLAVVDARVAWRATVGGCADGGAGVELTSDGGAQWVAVGTDPGLSTISGLRPETAAAGFVVGASTDCTVGAKGTVDGGSTWTAVAGPEGVWSLDPAHQRNVLAPGGASIKPCGDNVVVDVADVPGRASTAAALCADGEVVRTEDQGESWSSAGSPPGSLALALTTLGGGDAGVVVAGTSDDCAGIAVSAFDTASADTSSEAALTPLSCLGKDRPSEGDLDVSARGSVVWLLAGDETWVADGDLETWDVTD